MGTLLLSGLRVPVYAKQSEDFAHPNTEEGAETKWVASVVPLLPPNLVAGWTGHSERATLPSLFAAMQVPKAERDPLGRWAPTGSDDYVRTYRALMRNLAGRLRQVVCDGTLYVAGDEGDAMEDVVTFLSLKAPVSDTTKDLAASFTDMMKDFYEEVAMASEPLLVEAKLAVPMEKLAEDPATSEQAACEAPFVIAMSRRGTALCLHRSSGCWRAQGLIFQSYELWHEPTVPEHLYRTYCRDCWPREGPVVAAVGNCQSSSSSESSKS